MNLPPIWEGQTEQERHVGQNTLGQSRLAIVLSNLMASWRRQHSMIDHKVRSDCIVKNLGLED